MQNFPISAVLSRETITFVNANEFLRNGEVGTALLWGTQIERPRAIPGLNGFVTATDSKLMAKTTDGMVVTYSGVESTLTDTAPSTGVTFPHILAQTQDGKVIVVELEPGIKQTYKAGTDAILPGVIEQGKPLVMVTANDGSFKTYRTSVYQVAEGAPTGKGLRTHVKNLFLAKTGINPSLIAFELFSYATNPVGEPVADTAVAVTFDAKFSVVIDVFQNEIADILGKIGLGISHEAGTDNTIKLIVAPLA